MTVPAPLERPHTVPACCRVAVAATTLALLGSVATLALRLESAPTREGLALAALTLAVALVAVKTWVVALRRRHG